MLATQANGGKQVIRAADANAEQSQKGYGNSQTINTVGVDVIQDQNGYFNYQEIDITGKGSGVRQSQSGFLNSQTMIIGSAKNARDKTAHELSK